MLRRAGCNALHLSSMHMQRHAAVCPFPGAKRVCTADLLFWRSGTHQYVHHNITHLNFTEGRLSRIASFVQQQGSGWFRGAPRLLIESHKKQLCASRQRSRP